MTSNKKNIYKEFKPKMSIRICSQYTSKLLIKSYPCRKTITYNEFLETNEDLPLKFLTKIWNMERVYWNEILIEIPLLCCNCYRNKVWDEAFTSEENYYCFSCNLYSISIICPICRKNLKKHKIMWKKCPYCSEDTPIMMNRKVLKYCSNCGKSFLS